MSMVESVDLCLRGQSKPRGGWGQMWVTDTRAEAVVKAEET